MRNIVAALVLLAGPAHAQVARPDAEAPEETSEAAAFGEIVVTAQRRAENLQETPVAVTALGTEQLEQLQIEQTQDIAKAVPNLQLLPITANPSAFQVALRGGVEQASALITSEPAVAIYLDDVYRGRISGSNFELTDIERIEVLRGPQGTLYGRNAYSGAIKLITRKPEDEPWLNASVGYGAFEEVKLLGSVGGPVAEGLGASLSGLYRDRGEGWIRNIALGRKVGREEALALRGTLNWFGDDRWQATLSATYTRDRNDGYSAIPVAFPDPAARPLRTEEAIPLAGCRFCNQSPIEPRGRNDQLTVSLNVAYELGATTLRSITGYIRTEDFFRWDLSGGVRQPDGGFAATFVRNSDAETDQFSQELQALGTVGGLEWIVGLYYFQEDSRQVFNDVFSGFPLLPTELDTQTKSYAAFAQGSYALTDRLSATAGLRYTLDEKELTGSIQSSFVPPLGTATIELDDGFEAWTPRFGIEFEATPDLFFYGTVSRGFKAGGYNGLTVASPLVLSTVYDPQTIWAYELGAKLTALDDRLRANLAVFHNELQDLQQTANIAPFSFAIQNVGDAQVRGFELEVGAVPIDGLTLFGNLGYMDDDYERLEPGSEAALNNAERLPILSEWSYQLGFSYESGTLLPVRLKLGADYKHFSSYFNAVNNNVRIEGFGRLDAFAAVATANDRWELGISARNLTDERDYISAAQNIALTPAEPRSWMATLRYRL